MFKNLFSFLDTPKPWVLIVAFLTLTAQIGYVRVRGTGTVGTQACWATTNTIDSCGASESIDGSGTATVLPKFSDANTLTDSNINDSGTVVNITPGPTDLTISTPPSAGASGDIYLIDSSLAAMDGSDTVNFINIQIANADHTGSTNEVRALNFATFTGDTEATETAIYIGDGYDVGVSCPNGCTIDGDITIGTDDSDDLVIKNTVQNNVFFEGFDALGIRVAGATLATPGLTDGSLNIFLIPMSQLGVIGWATQSSDGLSSIGAVLGTRGSLSLASVVDDVNNDGIELVFGAYNPAISTNNYEANWFDEDDGEASICEVSFSIADISELDDLWFGWVASEAFDATPASATFDTAAYFTISDNAGDLDIETQLNAGGLLNDDTGVTWADAASHTLRVKANSDSVSFTLDGSTVTQTNAVLNFDNGDVAYCRFGYTLDTGDATPEPGVVIDYVKIIVNQ